MNKSLYTRPDKPDYKPVRKRRPAPGISTLSAPEVVTVDAATECHVTPSHVAARMVDYLGPADNQITLEPQAGTGNLINALVEAGYSASSIVAIERHQTLCNTLKTRFKGDQAITLMQRCFLEYAQEVSGKVQYPRILTNPPFKYIKKHMKAALSLLGAGNHDNAILVALVPITYDHDEAETYEVLDRDTFPNARVSTKIIAIER